MSQIAKHSFIEDFILEIKSLIKKVEDNRAMNSDYAKFQEMMELLGLQTETLTDVLKENGFQGWGDYYAARQKRDSEEDRYANIQPVVGGIKAIGQAAITILTRVLNEK